MNILLYVDLVIIYLSVHRNGIYLHTLVETWLTDEPGESS
jgi:hypothetical protein